MKKEVKKAAVKSGDAVAKMGMAKGVKNPNANIDLGKGYKVVSKGNGSSKKK